MRAEDIVVHVPLRKVLIGLFLTIIPVSVFGLYTVSQADSALKRAVGANIETLAAADASKVSLYVHERVQQVGALARIPTVVEAVRAANRAYAGLSDTAFQQKVERTEKIWATPAADSIVKPMLSSPAAAALRDQLTADRRLLRITLTDERGATIAATHKTLDYYQADEEFWQAISAQGRGAVNLTGILYDEVTKANYIGIGVPVVEPESNRFAGALDVLMDLSAILPAAATMQAGTTIRRMLVRNDGTVILGPGTTLSMNVKSPEFVALSADQPGRLTQGNRFTTLADGHSALVSIADTGLGGDYKNLPWSVVVAQDADEALAPILGVERLLLLFVFLGLAALVLLAVYFSLNRRVRYEDIADAMADRSERNETPVRI